MAGFRWEDHAGDLGERARDAIQQHDSWRQRWLGWLAVAQAGGIAVLLAFVAALPDPDFALKQLLLPISLFAFGLILVGPAALLFGETKFRLGAILLAKRDQALLQHVLQDLDPKDGPMPDLETNEEPHLKVARVVEPVAFACSAISAALFAAGLLVPLYGAAHGARLVPASSAVSEVPPCTEGRATCPPWERDWGSGGVRD